MPAVLACAFVTSLAGAAACALVSLTGGGVAPHRLPGPACGPGGGYLGACFRPRLPGRFVRLLLGALAAGAGVLHAARALA
ncbi:hypothetical protein [Streptomyces sp. NPDC003401]